MDTSSEKETFRIKALRRIRSTALSFLLAVTGLALFGTISGSLKIEGETRLKILLAAAMLSCLIWCVGALSGFMAFRSISPGSRFLGRIFALSGMLLNIFFAACGATAVLFEDGIAKMNPDGPPFAQMKQPQHIVTSHEKELIASVNKAFQLYSTNILDTYTAAAELLTNPPTLNLAGVSNIADLKYREKTVREYIEANKKLRDYVEDAPRIFKRLLESNGIDPTLQKSVMRYEFNDHWKKNQPIVLTLRSNEMERARYYLEALGFLEANWEEWTWEPQSPHVRFDDEDLADDYDDIVNDINSLYREEVKLQTEFKQHPFTNKVAGTNSPSQRN